MYQIREKFITIKRQITFYLHANKAVFVLCVYFLDIQIRMPTYIALNIRQVRVLLATNFLECNPFFVVNWV